MDLDNTWMGDRLGTPGAAGMGLETDATHRRLDCANPGSPGGCNSQVEHQEMVQPSGLYKF